MSRAFPASLPRSVRTCLLLIGFGCSGFVYASEYTVNTTQDTADTNSGDGICSTGSPGNCSLRAAIQDANAHSGPDSIILGPNVHPLATGSLEITDDLTLTGAGMDTSIIDGNRLDRVLDIKNRATVTINHVTLRNGRTTQSGGGIALGGQSTLNISGCRIANNEAAYGGGIYVDEGTLFVDQCSIENNTAEFGGGIYIYLNARADITKTSINNNISGWGSGIANFGGNTRVVDSLLHENRSGNAGAIVTGAQGSKLYLVNSTLSKNYSEVSAAAIFMFMGSTIYVSNSTIANNTAEKQVGGIIGNGSLFVQNSIIASNKSTVGRRDDCLGTIYSRGYNLLGDASGCNFVSAEGDQLGTPSAPLNPLLGPLTNNDGPTFTHALLPNSPALDAGNPLPMGRGGGACEATDQRGVSRVGSGRCDIGAFESTGPGETPTDPENNSGDVVNPFTDETGTAPSDTPPPTKGKPPAALADKIEPQVELELGHVGEEENKRLSALTLKRDESGRPYYYISNHSSDGIDTDLDDNRWFGMKNIRLGQGDFDKVTIVVGTAVAVIAGVVNLYLRSLSLFGYFLSFPLWSRVDPVPILMLATQEKKRRRKQGQRDTEQENRDGRLGRLLDDDRRAT